MSSWTLAIAALVDLGVAGALAYTGRVVTRRHPPGAGRAALLGFATWWYGLATTVLVNVFREASGAAGYQPPAWLVGVVHEAFVLALCAAVGGLLAYLVFLFTGSQRGLVFVATAYAGLALVSTLIALQLNPDGLVVGKWFVNFSYANPGAAGPFILLVTLLLLLPQLVAAGAYGTLWFRARDPVQRRRIAIVSVSLLVWLGASLFAPALRLGQYEWWQAGGRFVGLGASLAILVAFRPASTETHVRAEREDAFRRRVLELV